MYRKKLKVFFGIMFFLLLIVTLSIYKLTYDKIKYEKKNSYNWIFTNGKYKYGNSKNNIIGFYKIGNKLYQFDEKGFLVNHKGWEKYNSRKLFSNGVDGYEFNTVKEKRGVMYRFDSNGYAKQID